MIEVEGLIGKKTIKMWLENYAAIMAEDRLDDALPANSSGKSYDGVNNAKLNKLMLQAAIRDLPNRLRIVVELRWINRVSFKKALEQSGLLKNMYYRRCNAAVDFIYYHVNGRKAKLNDLINIIYRNNL